VRADLLVLGTGVVGGALLELLSSERAPRGIHVAGACNTRTPPLTDRLLDGLAASSPCPVLVDATPADGIEALYARALGRGIHVVTANKKPLVAPWHVRRELFAVAAERGLTIGREATVGAGLPIVGTLGDLVATGDRVRRVDCVLSGTLAFLCDELHAGTPLSRAIAEAKEKGYTEPDPWEDLGGADVARKAVILAREIGLPLEIGDVDLAPFAPRGEPIDDAAWARRAAEAEARGERLVYLARIDVDGTTARASAGLASLPRAHPAAASRGPVALASFTTDRYAAEPLVVRGPGAGGPVTASALVADVLRARGASSTVRERSAGTTRAGIKAACATPSVSGGSSASRSASTPAGS
jgi:aspartokinase/homoserine dehydrogenase 1